mmetsp:Transcript_5835/g.9064  ORF Transcript_5835/g.9064 Transcript_5835/m.9064 type:complete len:280 (+) Transcript_5835:997-1836(+)
MCWKRLGVPSKVQAATRSFSSIDPLLLTTGSSWLSRRSTSESLGSSNLMLRVRPSPYRALRRGMDPKHLNPPATMIPTFVQSASHSSMEWDVRITVPFLPPLSPEVIRERTSHRNLRFSGSTPLVGSSQNTSGGAPTIAIATLNLRLFPPDRVPAVRSANSSRLSSLILSLATLPTRCSGMHLIRAYSSRCSLTVRSSKSASNCGQYPIRRRRLLCSVKMSKPTSFAVPFVGKISPVRIFIVVVLPAPLTPRNPKHSPSATPNVKSSTATLPSPKTFRK